jgi:WD40 repeat protein
LKSNGHSSKITAMRSDPENENLIYTGSWDRTIKIYDVR